MEIEKHWCSFDNFIKILLQAIQSHHGINNIQFLKEEHNEEFNLFKR